MLFITFYLTPTPIVWGVSQLLYSIALLKRFHFHPSNCKSFHQLKLTINFNFVLVEFKWEWFKLWPISERQWRWKLPTQSTKLRWICIKVDSPFVFFWYLWCIVNSFHILWNLNDSLGTIYHGLSGSDKPWT